MDVNTHPVNKSTKKNSTPSIHNKKYLNNNAVLAQLLRKNKLLKTKDDVKTYNDGPDYDEYFVRKPTRKQLLQENVYERKDRSEQKKVLFSDEERNAFKEDGKFKSTSAMELPKISDRVSKMNATNFRVSQDSKDKQEMNIGSVKGHEIFAKTSSLNTKPLRTNIHQKGLPKQEIENKSTMLTRNVIKPGLSVSKKNNVNESIMTSDRKVPSLTSENKSGIKDQNRKEGLFFGNLLDMKSTSVSEDSGNINQGLFLPSRKKTPNVLRTDMVPSAPSILTRR